MMFKAVHGRDLAVNESFAKILIENISDPIEIGNERAFSLPFVISTKLKQLNWKLNLGAKTLHGIFFFIIYHQSSLFYQLFFNYLFISYFIVRMVDQTSNQTGC